MQVEMTMHSLIILENSDRDENGLLPLQHYELNVMQMNLQRALMLHPRKNLRKIEAWESGGNPDPHTLASIRS